MLSKSLLLTGALLTVEKEGAVYKQLLNIRETLDLAMDSIRESVHGLHEDSVDLKHTLEEFLQPMKKDYCTALDYYMAGTVPGQVKYCFIAVTKEAMSNIMKHSNGNQVQIRCRDHPGFYQLFIEDNGTVMQAINGRGLGIQNMRDRVGALGGTFHIHTDMGFGIFISTPKTEGNLCG